MFNLGYVTMSLVTDNSLYVGDYTLKLIKIDYVIHCQILHLPRNWFNSTFYQKHVEIEYCFLMDKTYLFVPVAECTIVENLSRQIYSDIAMGNNGFWNILPWLYFVCCNLFSRVYFFHLYLIMTVNYQLFLRKFSENE